MQHTEWGVIHGCSLGPSFVKHTFREMSPHSFECIHMFAQISLKFLKMILRSPFLGEHIYLRMFSHFKSQGLEAGFEEISQDHVTRKWRCQDTGPSSLAPEATLLTTPMVMRKRACSMETGRGMGFDAKKLGCPLMMGYSVSRR